MRRVVSAFVCVVVAGCDAEDSGEPVDCDLDFFSPCERKACEACRDEFGGQLAILESFPAIYVCEGDGFSFNEFEGSDYCRRGWCEETTSPASGTEPTRVPTDWRLREQVLGTHVSTLQWSPPGWTDTTKITPSGTTELSLFATAAGSPTRTLRYEKIVPTTDGVPDVAPEAISCIDHLELDVVLDIETADGGLLERTEAVIWMPFGGDIDAGTELEPSTRFSLNRADIAGELRVEPTDPELELGDTLQVSIVFGRERTHGEIEIGGQGSTEDWGFAFRDLVGRWPAE